MENIKTVDTKDGSTINAELVDHVEVLSSKSESFSLTVWSIAWLSLIVMVPAVLILMYIVMFRKQHYVKVFFKDGSHKCYWVDEQSKLALQSI